VDGSVQVADICTISPALDAVSAPLTRANLITLRDRVEG
jgi:hypothetical protein